MKTTLLADAFSAVGIFILVIAGSTGAVLLLLKVINAYLDRREEKRHGLLKGYVFPASCYAEVMQRYSHLTSEQVEIAFEQLRLYFEVCLVYLSPNSHNLAAMPSKLVDACWHSFICETREYQAFCKSVFGSFLHHESRVNSRFPLTHISANDIHNGKSANSLRDAQQEIDFKNQLSAARIFHWSLTIRCEKSNSEALQIPLLFSIDSEFDIEGGYFYSSEMLQFLAKFDLKGAEAVVTKRETDTTGGSAAACGDGGSCGGCGGSL
jgi:hypothetical protein